MDKYMPVIAPLKFQVACLRPFLKAENFESNIM